MFLDMKTNLEGRQAFKNGQTLADNPYSPSIETEYLRWMWWKNGWIAESQYQEFLRTEQLRYSNDGLFFV